MSTNALKAVAASIVLLAASGLAPQARRALASSQPDSPPLVRGISIHSAPGGAVVIDISLTQTVPYRTMQLSSPDRLVVDLEGAHEADLKGEYPAQSQVLERVRTSQWKSDPAVVRVVADLKGNPSFNIVKTQDSGIRIELKPRAAAAEQNHGSDAEDAEFAGSASGSEKETAQEDPSPKMVFQVHRFKDLSASLTAPVLPPHDRLVPVAKPDLPAASHKVAATLALVSGISIQPNDHGETTIDIASSRSIPYRVFQLADPFRLVIDLKDARNTSSQKVYQVNSPVLKRVRVGQWRPDGPPVVRVVADLEGYPIFDVHAQRPGVRIELKPRQPLGSLMRNPFEFKTQPQRARVDHPAAQSNPTLASRAVSRAATPDNAFGGLRVIGFVEKKETGTQAVIADHANIYFVSKGGTFENTFTVLEISPNAVQIQNTETLETSWIPYAH